MRCPPEFVVYRHTYSDVWNRHDGDPLEAGAVQGAQRRIQIGRSFVQVPGPAEIDLRSADPQGLGAEGQKGLVGRDEVGVEPDGKRRSVVREQLAWRNERCPVAMTIGKLHACNALNVALGHCSRTQNHGTGASCVDNCRFDADTRRAPIDHKLDLSAEIRCNMVGERRTDVTGSIGGWCAYGQASGLDESEGNAMIWNPQPNAVQSRNGQVANAALPAKRHDQGQRTRPKGGRELLGYRAEMTEVARQADRSDMHDQWVEGWPAFGGEHARNRKAIGCIGAQAIDRLCREGDEAAALEDGGTFGDCPRAGRHDGHFEAELHCGLSAGSWNVYFPISSSVISSSSGDQP